MTESLHAFSDEYHSGRSVRAYEYLGVHPMQKNGVPGWVFRVWAPNAEAVSVVGDFNFWNPSDLPMEKISGGIWEAWSEHAAEGQAYKYLIRHWSGKTVYKADPMAVETSEDTSSRIAVTPDYPWQDRDYMARLTDPLRRPFNIYQLDLDSWERQAGGARWSFQELGLKLAAYLKAMGYTHAELLPLCRCRCDEERGFLISEFFAPVSRCGGARGIMELVDTLHEAGIGVILDWSPLHFLKNEHGLMEFDGTCAYEISDPLAAEPEAWPTRQFDYAKPEVRSFLISNAVYWLETFHLDGLRVSGVSAMLYLDYGRDRYRPNEDGGRISLAAVSFLQQLNSVCFGLRPGILMAADESTGFPLVTRPDYDGGLGFLFNWNSGWRSDTLNYLRTEPDQRSGHHDLVTFPMSYAFTENYILPLSFEDVMGGRGGLTEQMPGDYFWKFAELRLLRGYQMTCPGKKLSFMGMEFGQFERWHPDRQLDWMLLSYDMHEKLLNFTRDLNEFYLSHDQLWVNDMGWGGYHWVQPDDSHNSVIAYLRNGFESRPLLMVLNFSRHLLEDYRMGLPERGLYEPVLCSDDLRYGGGGYAPTAVWAQESPFRDLQWSGLFRIPPMSVTVYQKKSREKR